jgi:hypothetical protein
MICCRNCGEDGDPVELDECGHSRCEDCITRKELYSGLCSGCLSEDRDRSAVRGGRESED